MIGFDARPAWLHFGKPVARARRMSMRVRLSLGLLGGVVATLLAAGTPLPARAVPAPAEQTDQASWAVSKMIEAARTTDAQT